MERFLSSMEYSPGFTGKQSANITVVAFAALAVMHASLEELETALNPTANGVTTWNGVIELFNEPGSGKPIRTDLGLAIHGIANKGVEEKAFLIVPTSLDAKPGVMLLPYYTATWTSTGTQIPVALGGRANHSFAGSVSLTDSGISAARTGQALGSVSQVPAFLHVVDVGECYGILRQFKMANAPDAATACYPLRLRWR